jgi:predicted SprT family Zn-dependent metalloprotease
MKDIKLLENYLGHWQKVLNLNDWNLRVELTDFNRKDYEQTGDIRVDLKNKKAVVLIANKETGKDIDEVILHELIHLLLWNLDHQLGGLTLNKDDYLGTLEETVGKLTKIIKAQRSN